MPADIKLIAMDMDGTLLLPQPRLQPISDACIRALHDADRAGIHLAIASGRVTDDAGFFALDANLPNIHILGVNGSCCLEKPFGPITENHSLPIPTAEAIIELLTQRGIQYGVFCPFDLVLSKPVVTPDDVRLHWGTYLLREGNRCRVHANAEGLQAAMATGVNKLLALDDRGPEMLAPVKAELEARFPEVEITSSWINNLEINPRGVNKGSAITALAHQLGITLDQVMAIGDNDNDIPMLQCAGCAVAMGNATPNVLACATHQTLTNAEDGVAAAIRSLALHEPITDVRPLK